MNSLADIRSLIIDMDGVLYHGNTPVKGLPEFFDFIQERGIEYVLATNNASATAARYQEKLRGMGVEVETRRILSSAQATAQYIRSIAPVGTRVFVVGDVGLRAEIAAAELTVANDDWENGADFVACGLDFGVTFEKLAQATLLIRAGARFIGTNPDTTFPTERGIVPGNGALLALLETASEVKPFIIGKPETPLYEMALQRIAAPPATTACVGDRLGTDTLGGKRAGITTILVLSGISTRADLAESEVEPDFIFADIDELRREWQKLPPRFSD